MTPADIAALRGLVDGFSGRFFFDAERGDLAYIDKACDKSPRECECDPHLNSDGDQDCSLSVGDLDGGDIDDAGEPIAQMLNALPALLDRVEELERDNAALTTRRDELLAAMVRVTRETPYPEEQGNAAVLMAEVGTLKARVQELERERDSWTSTAVESNGQWADATTARDKLARECERLRALVNRAADSLDYCVQRHGEYSKSVRGDELRAAAKEGLT